MDPRFVFVWPNAKTCMVDPKDASLYRDEHVSIPTIWTCITYFIYYDEYAIKINSMYKVKCFVEVCAGDENGIKQNQCIR